MTRTSYLTPHTLNLTPQTSHLKPHTSHLRPHTSHLTPHTSHLTPHSSHLTPHTSHLTAHTSHLTCKHVVRQQGVCTLHQQHQYRESVLYIYFRAIRAGAPHTDSRNGAGRLSCSHLPHVAAREAPLLLRSAACPTACVRRR